jgi:hypothetical protein
VLQIGQGELAMGMVARGEVTGTHQSAALEPRLAKPAKRIGDTGVLRISPEAVGLDRMRGD